MVQVDMISYNGVLKELSEQKDTNLLLCNGFNISLGIYTRYQNIFDRMEKNDENYVEVKEVLKMSVMVISKNFWVN